MVIVTVVMTEESAELLLDILAESQFPLMSDQTKVAEELYCAVDGALDEAYEDSDEDESEDDGFLEDEYEATSPRKIVCANCGNPVEDDIKRSYCDYCGRYLGVTFRV